MTDPTPSAAPSWIRKLSTFLHDPPSTAKEVTPHWRI
jgi:hypothetical protein